MNTRAPFALGISFYLNPNITTVTLHLHSNYRMIITGWCSPFWVTIVQETQETICIYIYILYIYTHVTYTYRQVYNIYVWRDYVPMLKQTPISWLPAVIPIFVLLRKHLRCSNPSIILSTHLSNRKTIYNQTNQSTTIYICIWLYISIHTYIHTYLPTYLVRTYLHTDLQYLYTLYLYLLVICYVAIG